MLAEPIVIAHRGASGYVPEHTLTAYFIAIQQGADYIEPDLVATRDGVLVARHENDITGTTDVASRLEFASRRTAKVVDGVPLEGWFTEDFTLAELQTLRARERIPELRPGNQRFDGQFLIPTFDEVLAFVAAMDEQRAAAALSQDKPLPPRIGVYPETKHPSYFRGIGLPLEPLLLDVLARHGFGDRGSPVFIQSFEVGNLRALRTLTELPLIQLIETDGAPFDFMFGGDSRLYADLVTADGLVEVASYADGVGVHKSLIIPRDAANELGEPTRLVADAHACGLLVHAWTFRAENHFLPQEFRAPRGIASTLGDMQGELRAYLNAGIDGFFTDYPDRGVAGRAA